MKTNTQPMTNYEKQKLRNNKINEVAQAAGWKSYTQLLTAIKDGTVECPIKPDNWKAIGLIRSGK